MLLLLLPDVDAPAMAGVLYLVNLDILVVDIDLAQVVVFHDVVRLNVDGGLSLTIRHNLVKVVPVGGTQAKPWKANAVTLSPIIQLLGTVKNSF